MSVVSVLHSELERARMQINRLMQEQWTGRDEVHHLIKCFTEEKTSRRSKERLTIEAAIASVAGDLEVERRLRRRLEGLNKNLEKELSGIKSAFMKVVRELESERRAREMTEQLCHELARVERLKSESVEAGKEREMLELAEKLREGRVRMKLSEAKHQFEEKSSAISKVRKQLEVLLGARRDKGDDGATCVSKTSISSDPQDEIARDRNSPFRFVEKEAHRRSYMDEMQRYRGVKGPGEHVASSPRSSLTGDCCSPCQQREQPLLSRKPK